MGRSRTPKCCYSKHGYLCLCIRLPGCLLLPSCGDIETNPGPSLSSNNKDDGKAKRQRSSANIVNSLKCGLMNTRSLRNKLTKFQLLLSANNSVIFAVTETWLSSDISDAEILAGLPYTTAIEMILLMVGEACC